MKNQKGITLIALVITIIVLLILAGVTIAMLSGENGILGRATSTKAANAEATAREEANLAYMAVRTEVAALKVKYGDLTADKRDIVVDGRTYDYCYKRLGEVVAGDLMDASDEYEHTDIVSKKGWSIDECNASSIIISYHNTALEQTGNKLTYTISLDDLKNVTMELSENTPYKYIEASN